MQTALQRRISTNPTTDFIEALAPGAASKVYDILLPYNIGRGGVVIQNIFVESMQQFSFDVNIYGTHAGALVATPGASTWLGYFSWASANLIQIPGSALFYGQFPFIEFPYRDDDNDALAGDQPWTLHAVLVNRDGAITKLANAPGAMKFTFMMATVGSYL